MEKCVILCCSVTNLFPNAQRKGEIDFLINHSITTNQIIGIAKNKKVSYPRGKLLGERLSECSGQVIVLRTVVNLVSSPKDGHL